MDQGRMPRIDSSRFAMVPRSDIPRSRFQFDYSIKTAFQAGLLIPIDWNEVLPGDVWEVRATIFARTATPVQPWMDRLQLETFWFFVPNRLVWDNWVRMMGERPNPSDSIDFEVPQLVSPAGGFPVNSIYDYFGLPTVGQVTAGQTVSVNALPLRMYGLIWDEWFRDQNLQNGTRSGWGWDKGDGPDTAVTHALMARNKRPDYFTTCLPWPLKGGVEVTMPMAGTAPITGLGVFTGEDPTDGNPGSTLQTSGGLASGWAGYWTSTTQQLRIQSSGTGAGSNPQIYADLTTATGATINMLRLAFATQGFLERDARGGTRYTESLLNHFGVQPEDVRLQRPEYIGGGRTDIQTQAIPQTSATAGGGYLGQLGAAATAADEHSYKYSATEHGWIIGLAHVGANLTYQQGLHRSWTRRTRLDYFYPDFAGLGEQAVLTQELYASGTDATDTTVFGYQERYGEYRERMGQITGMMRSTHATNIDDWHLAEQFGSAPSLNSAFLTDKTGTVMQRALLAGAAADNQQIIYDSVLNATVTRAMPMYSIPALIGRF